MSDSIDFAHLHEACVDSEQVFDGKLLDVRRDTVRLANGHESKREYIVHQGAVVVIPVLDNGDLIFERQFRYPLRRVFWELPAGKIDPGEATSVTAERELLEETGFVAKEWRQLGLLHPCIGYSNEKIEIFLARGLERLSIQQLDVGEQIELEFLPLDRAMELVRLGQITDAKTIVALFWAEKVLRSSW